MAIDLDKKSLEYVSGYSASIEVLEKSLTGKMRFPDWNSLLHDKSEDFKQGVNDGAAYIVQKMRESNKN